MTMGSPSSSTTPLGWEVLLCLVPTNLRLTCCRLHDSTHRSWCGYCWCACPGNE
jgi:hypothetical protein